MQRRCVNVSVHPYTFALDIGTRSVVGIIMKQEDDQYHIIDMISKEHEERAMLDGQIHDVPSVAKVINEIKNELEGKYGPLSKVCVAAAGRALRTDRAQEKIEITGKSLIKREDILHMELSAVQKAQRVLAASYENDKSTNYYCVGYSVIHYFLDEEEIGSLIDQTGKTAGVEVIATFLPKVVVESLISALHRANLEMEALTLEPIAALNVLIPPTMRRLNVALVDIGAGTSDIALTDLGTIVAYGMVPVAGDEITEAISDQYLLDFPLAEKAKRDLSENSSIIINDILGFETEVPRQEVVKNIYDSINNLATSISEEILVLNKKPPKAVMLIGGGSMTPELPKLLAEKLKLPENRVAIRGIDAINNLEFSDYVQKGPEFVTPIGIAIAAKKNPVEYISVTVNGQSVRLFDMKKLTVGDCILAAGIDVKKLYGRPGEAIIVQMNGRDITIPGTHGQAPIITRNNHTAFLDDEINSGDQIVVEKGISGKRASVTVSDLVDETPYKNITINQKPVKINVTFIKNGKSVLENEELEDHDKIEIAFPKTAKEIFQQLNYKDGLDCVPFNLYLNKHKVTLPEFGKKLLKNGTEASIDTIIEDGDSILIKESQHPTIKDLITAKKLELTQKIDITFNGEPITLTKQCIDIFRDGEILKLSSPIFVNDHIQVIEKKREPFIYQDVFRFININKPEQSGRFSLLKNNEPTTFFEEILTGDSLEIKWLDN